MSPSAMPISGPLKYRTCCGPNPLPPSNPCAAKVLKGWSCSTGDRPESAAIVAKELHLDEYRAGLLPEGKAAELESLGPRQSVLFVGDGINDAPVLAMSGVGVAMGGLGSEAAIEVADAVILDDSPSRLPEMFSIAAKTRVVVWQNIVMALGIKGLFMVLGVVGLSGLWEAVFRRRRRRPPRRPQRDPYSTLRGKGERSIGEGEEKLSSESFSSPSPNPTLSSSKTFVFIESLFRVFNMLKDEVLFFFRPQ